MNPRQGEVWFTAFQEGWERPAIVVSRDELNKGRLVLAVPCTSSRIQERRKWANHVFLSQGEGGLPADSVAQCHLVQPVETAYLLKRYGALTPQKLSELLLALAWTTALFERLAQ
ncbi:MAG: type II toxin-antitoxin system PemK/MazF family toxin [Planctomycetes bacterium]|nr:type II toxin-antitoxin system PemK/MazF family toxin [Planctomycetota bacterium]